MFDRVFTNIFGDTEVAAYSPDADNDWHLLGDHTANWHYWNSGIVDILRSLDSAGKDCYILKGGVISDSGSGQIDISAGIGITKDASGNSKLVQIPALTNITLPLGWKDNRQIWVILQYDFKLGSATRAHYSGPTYHYQLNDTYLGDTLGGQGGSTDSLFVDSDPNTTPDTVCCLGSFQMSVGDVFTDLSSGERTEYFAIQLANALFHIDKTNNRIGINNNTPLQDLDIAGNVRLSGQLQFGSDVSLVRGAANRLEFGSGDSLSVPGNIKIGAGGTSSKLHIVDTTTDSNPDILIENDAQGWSMKTTGASLDRFILRDVTGTNDVLRILPGTPGLALEFNSGELVVNENGVDYNFRVEGDTLDNLFVINAGNNAVGIGTSDPKELLHNTGEYLTSNNKFFGSNLYFDGNWKYLTNGYGAYLKMSDAGGNFEVCTVPLNASGAGAAAAPVCYLRMTNDGKLSTNRETLPDVDPGGLCLNQGTGTGNLITLKHSTLAHGVTDEAETDTGVIINTSSGGGLTLKGICEFTAGVFVSAIGTTANSTISSLASGAYQISSKRASGTGTVAYADSNNIFVLENKNDAKFIVQGAGHLYTDSTGGSGGAGDATVRYYDNEDDIMLAEAARYAIGNKKWKNDIMKRHGERLEELGIMKNGFMWHQGIDALNLGAIGQLWNAMRGAFKKIGITEKDLLTMAKEY